MSEIAQRLFTDWVEENAPPGLFDLEEKKKNESPTSSNGTKGRGDNKDRKEVKD